MDVPLDPDVRAHYELGQESGRLVVPSLGQLEFERTKEILQRHLPEPGATMADIGGGPGRYSVWLAAHGYHVIHRDPMPLHVEQARALAADETVVVDADVGDARALDLDDGSADAVLLLGPLYHLPERGDRLTALREARRIVRAGGHVFVAAISRWAPLLHGILVQRIEVEFPEALDLLGGVERTGVLPALFPGSFSGFCHRPDELREEVAEAGLESLDLVSVEALAFALADLDERWADETGRARILDIARRIERVPELLGLGPHLLLTARKPAE